MEEQQTRSSKGGVLMKGTDHSERVSVKMVEEDTKKNIAEVASKPVERPVKDHENTRDSVEVQVEDVIYDDTLPEGIGPEGRWRNKLCDCTQIIGCNSLFCMSSFCSIVVLAQLMTRLGLDWCGVPNLAAAAATFSVVIMLYFSFWCSILMVFGLLFIPCMFFWLLAICTRTRYETRRYFQIPADYCTCCNGAGEDFLMMTVCHCCSTVQIARHTHDEERYPYHYNEPTGLGPEAPPLYEGMNIGGSEQFD